MTQIAAACSMHGIAAYFHAPLHRVRVCCSLWNYSGGLLQSATHFSSRASQQGLPEHEQPHLLPKVAIVGRPNVGKSALFNRLVRRRVALVFDTPQSHVTRDWREETARLGDLVFRVADTSGLEPHADASTITARAADLTRKMLGHANLTLMVIDAQTGMVGPDEELAAWLHTVVPPHRVLLVANKADGASARKAMEQTEIDCYRLGFGEPIAVAAITGDGMTDLYTALQPYVDSARAQLLKSAGMDPSVLMAGRGTKKRGGRGRVKEEVGDGSTYLKQGQVSKVEGRGGEGDEEEVEGVSGEEEGPGAARPVKVTIMGLPNAGKSTLTNALLGEERVLTGPEPGLTRDSVSASLTWEDHKFELVDTAGYVGQTKVAAYDDVGGDVAAAARSAGLRSLASTNVVVLVVDAAEALRTQKVLRAREEALVSQVASEGKALVVVANKMDCMRSEEERKAYITTLTRRLEEGMRGSGSPVLVEMSAREGTGVNRLLPKVMDAYTAWDGKVSTGRLNRLVAQLTAGAGGAGGPTAGLNRLKYAVQVSSRPPTFLTFLSGWQPVAESFPRYLASAFRDGLGLRGTPIRVRFRYKGTRKEQDEEKKAPPKNASDAAEPFTPFQGPAPSVVMAQRAKAVVKESGGLAKAKHDDGGVYSRGDGEGEEWSEGEEEGEEAHKAGKGKGKEGREEGGEGGRKSKGVGERGSSQSLSISDEMRQAAEAREAARLRAQSPPQPRTRSPTREEREEEEEEEEERRGGRKEGGAMGSYRGDSVRFQPGASEGQRYPPSDRSHSNSRQRGDSDSRSRAESESGSGSRRGGARSRAGAVPVVGGKAAMMAAYMQRLARSPSAPLTHVQGQRVAKGRKWGKERAQREGGSEE